MSYQEFKHSPAESIMDSFVSSSTDFFPPLFEDTMNPVEVLTPQSFDGDSHFSGGLSIVNAPEKKPIKKRKSWGQQLPEPKTNLPPRKRAKTEDEKEQRRVERVLRNRRAAQSSRERKRQEVEALEIEKRAIERRNMDLEMRLADLEARYYLLQQELKRVGGCSEASFSPYSSSLTSKTSELRQQSPITFSQELFNLNDKIHRPMSPRSISPRTSATVDPSTLSPKSLSSVDLFNATSSDMIQHPAVSVGNRAAVDEFNTSSFDIDFANLDVDLPLPDMQNLFKISHPSEIVCSTENEILSHNENFNSEFDQIDDHHDGVFDEFVLCDYLNEELQSTENQYSSQLTDTATSLHPQYGAFSHGCDDSGIAARA